MHLRLSKSSFRPFKSLGSRARLRLAETMGVIWVGALLAGCAGSGEESAEAVSGTCAGGKCTGVCVDQVKDYARAKLGREATDVFFAFGNDNPAALSQAVVYFRTEACTTGEYQAEFYGTSVSCSNVHRGRLPDNVGKLLVVPEGCES